MMPLPLRAAWSSAALLSLGLVAACSGNDVLGPPDGTACTVGTIAPGDSAKQEITGASCAGFSDYAYANIWFQSWTLHARKNTAYVVRLRHVENAAAADNINADLYAYARNPAGDPVFATGWWNSFGASNANSGANEEMYLVGDKDRDYSIRVQIYDQADTGAYTLSVVSCPMQALTVGTPIAGIDLAASTCTSNAFYGGATVRKLTFLGFQADSFHTYNAMDSVTAGAGTLYGVVTGPDMDVGCYTDNCTYATSTYGVPNFNFGVNIGYGGLHTFMAAVNADSAATVTAEVTSTPIPAPHPATSTRPRPAGARNR